MPEKIVIDTTELEELLAQGMTLKDAALEMGLNPATLYQRASSDSEIKNAVTRGQFKAREAGLLSPPSANGDGAHGDEKPAAKRPTKKRASKKAARKARTATPAPSKQEAGNPPPSTLARTRLRRPTWSCSTCAGGASPRSISTR